MSVVSKQKLKKNSELSNSIQFLGTVQNNETIYHTCMVLCC